MKQILTLTTKSEITNTQKDEKNQKKEEPSEKTIQFLLNYSKATSFYNIKLPKKNSFVIMN